MKECTSAAMIRRAMTIKLRTGNKPDRKATIDLFKIIAEWNTPLIIVSDTVDVKQGCIARITDLDISIRSNGESLTS